MNLTPDEFNNNFNELSNIINGEIIKFDNKNMNTLNGVNSVILTNTTDKIVFNDTIIDVNNKDYCEVQFNGDMLDSWNIHHNDSVFIKKAHTSEFTDIFKSTPKTMLFKETINSRSVYNLYRVIGFVKIVDNSIRFPQNYIPNKVMCEIMKDIRFVSKTHFFKKIAPYENKNNWVNNAIVLKVDSDGYLYADMINALTLVGVAEYVQHSKN